MPFKIRDVTKYQDAVGVEQQRELEVCEQEDDAAHAHQQQARQYEPRHRADRQRYLQGGWISMLEPSFHLHNHLNISEFNPGTHL